MRAAALLACLLPLLAARATTVPPITEAEQIARAVLIAHVRAESVTAARERPNAGPIVTTVRFAPLAVYKGVAPEPLRLSFLGGRVGDLEMKVGSMPLFEEGAEYVIFLSAEENAACPLVGWLDGSLPVTRTAGGGVTVGLPPGEIVPPESRSVLPEALPLAEFERRLREALAAAGS